MKDGKQMKMENMIFFSQNNKASIVATLSIFRQVVLQYHTMVWSIYCLSHPVSLSLSFSIRSDHFLWEYSFSNENEFFFIYVLLKTPTSFDTILSSLLYTKKRDTFVKIADDEGDQRVFTILPYIEVRSPPSFCARYFQIDV